MSPVEISCEDVRVIDEVRTLSFSALRKDNWKRDTYIITRTLHAIYIFGTVG